MRGDASVAYLTASAEDVAFFREHGWLVVKGAIDPDDIVRLASRCDEILANPDEMAFDWAWEKGTPREARAFRILQAGPTRRWPELNDERFRQ